MKFYMCSHCKNQVLMVKAMGPKVVCCGEPMQELVPNTTDASFEKHVPAVKVDGDLVKVQIGSTPHPMTEEHYIEWIALETDKGGQIAYLKPNAEPRAQFALAGAKPIAVYAYCNLHGFWKKDI